MFNVSMATYIGFMPSDELLERILGDALRKAGLWGLDQEIAFPLITRSGTNRQGKTVRYYFNYSPQAASFRYPHAAGMELLANRAVLNGAAQQLPPWGVLIVLQD